MEKYWIKIGSPDPQVQTFGGEYKARSTKQLKEMILDQIENLWPINSSKEGAEEYRNRFRGKKIFAIKQGEKEYKEI